MTVLRSLHRWRMACCRKAENYIASIDPATAEVPGPEFARGNARPMPIAQFEAAHRAFKEGPWGRL